MFLSSFSFYVVMNFPEVSCHEWKFYLQGNAYTLVDCFWLSRPITSFELLIKHRWKTWETLLHIHGKWATSCLCCNLCAILRNLISTLQSSLLFTDWSIGSFFCFFLMAPEMWWLACGMLCFQSFLLTFPDNRVRKPRHRIFVEMVKLTWDIISANLRTKCIEIISSKIYVFRSRRPSGSEDDQ